MTTLPIRARLRAILAGEDPVWSHRFGLALTGLILATALVVALETVKSLPDWLRAVLAMLELAAAVFFGLEYALRLWIAERRLAYALSFWGLVDLLSFLPTLLFLGTDLIAARALRLLRLLRLLKLVRSEHAMDRLANAIAEVRDELVVMLCAVALALYLSAVGIYTFEHEAQPEAFSSIPASLWWAIATLTTVGYGDVYPVTAGGRIFTGVVLLLAIGLVSVPVALIVTALTAQARRNHRRDRDDA